MQRRQIEIIQSYFAQHELSHHTVPLTARCHAQKRSRTSIFVDPKNSFDLLPGGFYSPVLQKAHTFTKAFIGGVFRGMGFSSIEVIPVVVELGHLQLISVSKTSLVLILNFKPGTQPPTTIISKIPPFINNNFLTFYYLNKIHFFTKKLKNFNFR